MGAMMPQYPRYVTPSLLAALADTPVVVLHGPRQAGKSTLVQSLAASEHPARYLTLDQASVLSAARNDPEGFLAAQRDPVVIDEVQRAPELLLAIKAEVDRDRRPGRFLLTGSANILQLPRLAETLVGRMQILTLYPLSQGELTRTRERFIDTVFSDTLSVPRIAQARKARTHSRINTLHKVLFGGYPEALTRKNEERRRDWFESYLSTMIYRDLRDLSNIAGLSDLPRLLALIAARAGGLVNYAELGRDAAINQITLKRYVTMLQATFLAWTVRPWFTNRSKRIVKSEKLYLGDTGLLAHLLNVGSDELKSSPPAIGALLENFVALELLKQRSWSKIRPEILYFREYGGSEVDLVLEGKGGGKIVGIEVKASATVRADDFKGLHVLAKTAGSRFHRGILLYTGEELIPFGSEMYAMPVSNLWEVGVQEKQTQRH
jgi:uncharacterized protein